MGIWLSCCAPAHLSPCPVSRLKSDTFFIMFLFFFLTWKALLVRFTFYVPLHLHGGPYLVLDGMSIWVLINGQVPIFSKKRWNLLAASSYTRSRILDDVCGLPPQSLYLHIFKGCHWQHLKYCRSRWERNKSQALQAFDKNLRMFLKSTITYFIDREMVRLILYYSQFWELW